MQDTPQADDSLKFSGRFTLTGIPAIDPVADGVSKDLWTSSLGSVDVHFSSGVGNLAFIIPSQTLFQRRVPRGP